MLRSGELVDLHCQVDDETDEAITKGENDDQEQTRNAWWAASLEKKLVARSSAAQRQVDDLDLQVCF